MLNITDRRLYILQNFPQEVYCLESEPPYAGSYTFEYLLWFMYNTPEISRTILLNAPSPIDQSTHGLSTNNLFLSTSRASVTTDEDSLSSESNDSSSSLSSSGFFFDERHVFQGDPPSSGYASPIRGRGYVEDEVDSPVGGDSDEELTQPVYLQFTQNQLITDFSRYGDTRCLQLLIDLGVELAFTQDGLNVLHYAVLNPETHVLSFILQKLKDDESHPQILSSFMEMEEPTNQLSPITLAINQQRTDHVMILAAYGADIYVENEQKENVIHYLSKNGLVEHLKTLSSSRDEPLSLEVQNLKGYTALGLAIINKDLKMVRTLVELGAVWWPTHRIQGSMIPLYQAILVRDVLICRYFLALSNGFTHTSLKYQKLTEIEFAVKCNAYSVVELLLQVNSKPDAFREEIKKDIELNLSEIEKSIQTKFIADLDSIQDSKKKHAGLLHIAIANLSDHAREGQTSDLVKMLELLLGSDMVNIEEIGPSTHFANGVKKRYFPMTPLQLAVLVQRYSAISFLLEKGADPYLTVEAPGLLGNDELTLQLNSMHFAIQSGSIQCVKALLAHGFELNLTTKDINYALYAAHLNKKNIFSLFVQNGFSVEPKDRPENNLLHFAAKFNDIPSIIKLTDRPDVKNIINLVNHEGLTPLMLAVSNCDSSYEADYDSVDSLMKLGADWSIMSNDGQNVLGYSAAHGNIQQTITEALLCEIQDKEFDHRGAGPFIQINAQGRYWLAPNQTDKYDVEVFRGMGAIEYHKGFDLANIAAYTQSSHTAMTSETALNTVQKLRLAYQTIYDFKDLTRSKRDPYDNQESGKEELERLNPNPEDPVISAYYRIYYEILAFLDSDAIKADLIDIQDANIKDILSFLKLPEDEAEKVNVLIGIIKDVLEKFTNYCIVVEKVGNDQSLDLDHVEAISLIWLAIQDLKHIEAVKVLDASKLTAEQYELEVKTIIQELRKQLWSALIQTEYEYRYTNDQSDDDMTACIHGVYMSIVSCLNLQHDLVKVASEVVEVAPNEPFVFDLENLIKEVMLMNPYYSLLVQKLLNLAAEDMTSENFLGTRFGHLFESKKVLDTASILFERLLGGMKKHLLNFPSKYLIGLEQNIEQEYRTKALVALELSLSQFNWGKLPGLLIQAVRERVLRYSKQESAAVAESILTGTRHSDFEITELELDDWKTIWQPMEGELYSRIFQADFYLQLSPAKKQLLIDRLKLKQPSIVQRPLSNSTDEQDALDAFFINQATQLTQFNELMARNRAERKRKRETRADEETDSAESSANTPTYM